jgi:hypothetical protein
MAVVGLVCCNETAEVAVKPPDQPTLTAASKRNLRGMTFPDFCEEIRKVGTVVEVFVRHLARKVEMIR